MKHADRFAFEFLRELEDQRLPPLDGLLAADRAFLLKRGDVLYELDLSGGEVQLLG